MALKQYLAEKGVGLEWGTLFGKPPAARTKIILVKMAKNLASASAFMYLELFPHLRIKVIFVTTWMDLDSIMLTKIS